MVTNLQHNTAIQKACAFITRSTEVPSLQQVARHVGLSPSRFHSVFSEALGITPRHFADAHRQKRFKRALTSGDSIAGALYSAGYGSSSRVYEFAHRYLGMTPKEYQNGGKAQTIWFTLVQCPLGHMLIAATQKGICFLHIGNNKKELWKELKNQFHAAQLTAG